MYLYRNKYSFLLEHYNPRYKYYSLLLECFKSLTFIFIILYNEYIELSNYSLIFINFINIIIYFYSSNIFNNLKNNYNFIFLHIISIIQIIFSLTNDLYDYIYTIKYTVFGLNVIYIFYLNYNFKKIIFEENNILEEYIEMDIIE